MTNRWETRGDSRGGWIQYEAAPDESGIPGAGTVHHVAWASTMEDEERWRERVAAAGGRPTDVIDRFWFRSIYFREPNGVLFEIATLGPGLRNRRGSGTSRRDADPAAGIRAPACAGRADPHAAAESARELEPNVVTLRALERPASGEPEGALVLLHGRGADEHDLYPLLDALDPERRLHGYTPRAPLALPPGGAHWYVVPRVGYPDPETFAEGYGALTGWFDALPFAAGEIVLGGFSQGAVMSYALGAREGAAANASPDRAERLHPDRRELGARPRPAVSAHRRSRTARTTRSFRSSSAAQHATGSRPPAPTSGTASRRSSMRSIRRS